MRVSIGYVDDLILFVGLRQFRVSSAVVMLACTGSQDFDLPFCLCSDPHPWS